MKKNAGDRPNEPIAIIGISGIFPGSNTVSEFFENTLRKRCFIRELPDWAWEKEVFFDEDRYTALKTYSHIGAVFGDLEIDLGSFNIPPAVQKQISLNQQLALACAREALADSGYLERDFNRERTGIIIAATAGELWQRHFESAFSQNLRTRLKRLCDTQAQKNIIEELWDKYESAYPDLPINEDSLPGAIGSVVTGRIASALNLNGPQFILDSACASSLTAVATAVTNLRSGICDMVVTGGVETDASAISYVTLSKVRALSGKGGFPFDDRADGFVIGQGCGIMLLKRYSDAVRDGDRIYALVRGVGNSSDGAGKGILAPNRKGQVLALRRAYDDAGVAPSSIRYIECHGTGTRVGDATELSSVNQLIAESVDLDNEHKPVAIGSVKAMLGHCRKAAGMAGLFRALLTVNSRAIPPQVNFGKANTEFDWKKAHLRIPRVPEPVSEDEVHVGVSGFGFGGANSHVVLSSSPVNAREPLVNIDDLVLPKLPALRNDIAFTFPGQGSQYVNMLKHLRKDAVAESYFALADEIVSEISGRTLSDFIYPASRAEDSDDQHSQHEAILRDTAIAQPAIFVISVILLEKLREIGIEPAMMLGHSLGEYSALYAAGILSFEDALRAVSRRGCLMMKAGKSDPGTMAFVEGNFRHVGGIISNVEGYVVCANLNSYDQTVVSGETGAVNRVVELAAELGLNAHTLNVDRAFHSRIVSSCVADMRDYMDTLEYRTSSIPIPANISRQVYPFVRDAGSSGKPMCASDREHVIDLLCKQIDHPVDFVSQVELAYESGVRRFVEVGPKSVLTHLVDDILQGKSF